MIMQTEIKYMSKRQKGIDIIWEMQYNIPNN